MGTTTFVVDTPGSGRIVPAVIAAIAGTSSMRVCLASGGAISHVLDAKLASASAGGDHPVGPSILEDRRARGECGTEHRRDAQVLPKGPYGATVEVFSRKPTTVCEDAEGESPALRRF